MMEHSVSKLSESNHWAINAQVVALSTEKGESNIYSSKHISKLQDELASRSVSSQTTVPKKGNQVTYGGVMNGENGSTKDTASVISDSGVTASSGIQETRPGRHNDTQAKGRSSSPSFNSRYPFLLSY